MIHLNLWNESLLLIRVVLGKSCNSSGNSRNTQLKTWISKTVPGKMGHNVLWLWLICFSGPVMKNYRVASTSEGFIIELEAVVSTFQVLHLISFGTCDARNDNLKNPAMRYLNYTSKPEHAQFTTCQDRHSHFFVSFFPCRWRSPHWMMSLNTSLKRQRTVFIPTCHLSPTILASVCGDTAFINTWVQFYTPTNTCFCVQQIFYLLQSVLPPPLLQLK